MTRLKKILNSPVLALGLTPLIFAISQIIILGFYWLNKGYAGDFTITVSRYVGLELWSSILFAICNLAIIIIMFRYYLYLRPSRSKLWFIFGCLQVAGFSLLSIFPANAFMPSPVREVVVNIHEVSARVMFASMLLMAAETLRFTFPNHLKFLQKLSLTKFPKNIIFLKTATPACIAFIALGCLYLSAFFFKSPLYENFVLITETSYIYGFIAFLLLTQSKTE